MAVGAAGVLDQETQEEGISAGGGGKFMFAGVMSPPSLLLSMVCVGGWVVGARTADVSWPPSCSCCMQTC